MWEEKKKKSFKKVSVTRFLVVAAGSCNDFSLVGFDVFIVQSGEECEV